MPISNVEFSSAAMDVLPDPNSLRVLLLDGREIAVPFEYFPRLRDATPEQRARFTISAGGEGLHWDEIDEDISVATLLRRH